MSTAADRAEAPLLPLPKRVRAVLLDRDGTILDETGYLVDPERVVLLPSVGAAIARANSAGVPVAVVTNQSAIARGLLDESGLAAIHARIAELLRGDGAHVDLWLHAASHPEHGPPAGPIEARRRKPGPGMLLEALERFGVAPEHAVTIGDSDRDLEAGERCGVAGILVLSGKGAAQRAVARARLGREPRTARDLASALELVLGDRGQER